MTSAQPRDDGEVPAQMEPMLPSATGHNRRRLEDLAVDLVAKAHRLAAQLHPNVRSEIGTLVRSMNCCYSNLIEGHNTHPVDIDRALRGDYSGDPAKRALQREARAHIDVQAMLDGTLHSEASGLRDAPTSVPFLQAVHREFCSRLPEDLLRVENPETGERVRVVPGEFRQRHVKVGRHVPVSPGAVMRFLTRFEATVSWPTYSTMSESSTQTCDGPAKIRWYRARMSSNPRMIPPRGLLSEMSSPGAHTAPNASSERWLKAK
jgi:hypothetical protein